IATAHSVIKWPVLLVQQVSIHPRRGAGDEHLYYPSHPLADPGAVRSWAADFFDRPGHPRRPLRHRPEPAPVVAAGRADPASALRSGFTAVAAVHPLHALRF